MTCNGSQQVVSHGHPDCPFFIAVHVGVGQHSVQKEKAYKSVLRQACRIGAHELQKTGDPRQAVITAIASLEDAPLGNAGVNSNLTVKGVVQCDASVMAGDGAFGAVGAVSGVKNPVRVAGELARQSREPMALGRVRPMFLAGDGAREWAQEQGLETASSLEDARQWHVTSTAQRRWQRYKCMIDEASHGRCAPAGAAASRTPTEHAGEQDTGEIEAATPAAKRPRTDSAGGSAVPASAPLHRSKSLEEDDGCLAYDTVGAVCVDAQGRVAAGVSSGGIAMKTDGRVGEAAMFGCGCWAADAEPRSGRPAVACSVTGVGEAIMRAGLSRACADGLASDAAPAGFDGLATSAQSTVDAICAHEIRQRIELGQPRGLPCPHHDCGVIAVRVSCAPAGTGAVTDSGGAHCRVSDGALEPGGRECSGGVSKTAEDCPGTAMHADVDQAMPGCAVRDGGKMDAGASCRAHDEATVLTDSVQDPVADTKRDVQGESVLHVEFDAVHNSASMGVGYWAPGLESPVCSILRSFSPGTDSAGAGMCFIGTKHSWQSAMHMEIATMGA